MGLWKNEEITELLCRLAFVIPMIKWLLLDTVKKLNKDISILQELDGDINNNEMKTMEDLQDIQKVIFQHRKGCYAIQRLYIIYLKIMMRIELIGKQECKTILVKYFLTDYNEMATNWQQKISEPK